MKEALVSPLLLVDTGTTQFLIWEMFFLNLTQKQIT